MKIVLLPLDERPCNAFYPNLIPLDQEISVITCPQELLSKQKKVCDLTKLADWLLKESRNADFLIVSLDTLLYGGIIPSRIHHMNLEDIKKRSEILRTIKAENPKIKIYANELIMRCPAYSIAVEEPNYFDECGFEINKHGKFLDKQLQGCITEEEIQEMNENKKHIKDEYLFDLMNRREINKQAIIYNLNLAKEGIVDFFSIPQDDCAPFGFTCIDRRAILKVIEEQKIENVMMYPGADEVGLDLLSRALNTYYEYSPKVFLCYACEEGRNKIPEFEDKPLEETVLNHLKVAKCRVVKSLKEADICYAVDCGCDFVATNDPRKAQTLSSRDLKKFINYINITLSDNKIAAIADVAYTNKGDPMLFNELAKYNLLGKIHSYAGWNTNSNTLGTTTCGAIGAFYLKSITAKNYFLINRYLEDVFYMADARDLIKDMINSKNMDFNNLGDTKEEYSQIIKKRLLELYSDYKLDKLYKIKSLEVSFPWNRIFEVFVEVK